LVLGYLNVANSGVQAKDLLELKFGRVRFQEFYPGAATAYSKGNFPVTDESLNDSDTKEERYDTLGKTRTQKTRNLPDQSLEGSVVLLCELPPVLFSLYAP